MSPAKPYILSCYLNIMVHFVPKNEGRFFRKKLEEWERIKSAIGEKYKKKPNKIPFILS